MPKKKPNDYPMKICGGCAEEYGRAGFRVEFAKPREMIVTEVCSLCGKHVPVYAARLAGRKIRRPRIPS